MEFFAYHGYFAEEQKMGNRYSLDITVHTDFEKAAQEDRLSDTVNYVDLYQVAVKVMQEPARLLEHIAYRLIEEIKKLHPEIGRVEVSVSKFNPPIGGVCERSRITMAG